MAPQEIARLRALIAHTSDIITILDAQGIIRYENPAIEQVLGYAPDDLVGRMALDLIHPDDQTKVAEALMDAWTNPEDTPAPVVFRFIHSDGSWRMLEATGRLTQKDTEIADMVVTSRDVTERERVQEALRNREEQLHREAEHLTKVAAAQNAIVVAQRGVVQVIDEILVQTRELIVADGVALLSVEGDELVTSAGWGMSEPYIGVHLSLQTSLAGRSANEDRVLRCNDSETDPRVDREGCRRVGIRSLMAAPLRHGESTSWVLLYIAAEPNAFRERDEQTLDLIRGLCAAALSGAVEFEARQAALRALSDSEQRFKNAFEWSAIGMALVSLEGQWLQVNRRLCELLGYTPEELMKITFQDITYPDDLQSDLELLQSLVAGEITSYELEKRYLHKNGSVVWALLNVSLLRDENGAPLHFISQVQDISERKRTEDALRSSEARKAAIVEASLDCIITMDHAGYITEWNSAAETTFGYRREYAIGRLLQDLIVPPELREAHRRGLQKYIETGIGPVIGQRLELPAVRADGSTILVELAILPVPNYEPPLFSGHLRDITQRKQNENALRESEARYMRIATNVPGMVYQYLLRPDGTVALPFVSEGCREIYGLEPQEIQQNPSMISDLIHPDDLRTMTHSVEQSAVTLTPWEWEGRIILPGGQEKWLQGAARPRREDNGDIIWDGFLFDITQRKSYESEIQRARQDAEEARVEAVEAQSEAERANVAKSDFLSRMSHELRTPLNAILGFGQLMELSELDEGDRQSVEQILKGGRHLLELINEVLDIASIEAGRLSLSLEPVRVSEIFDEALSLVGPLAAQRAVALHKSYEDKTLSQLYVRADRQRLKQVVLNLLSNAVKYNRDGGKITLRCTTGQQGRMRLCVSDTGMGIEPEKRNRLFMPFERLGVERQGIEGTGIGLALSRRLAEAMGGVLDMDSVPGQGSTFWIELPTAQSPLQDLEASLNDGADGTGKIESAGDMPRRKQTVLYIEDNLSNLRLMQRLIQRRANIELISAMQGRLGLELAQRHLPDLILLDLNLPEMEGAEVLSHLRAGEATRDIPVVVISADATPGQIERLLAGGARHYLTKPFSVREFFDVLDEMLSPVETV